MELLRAASLRDQAHEVIRASIVGGELEPGAIVSAATLAERLGVSATPVREAMLDLAHAGLVEPVRNRGYRILAPDDRDLDEISDLRLMLEPPGVRKTTELASAAQLDALEREVDAIEASAERGDLTAFLSADRRFHLGLLELTGNLRLVRLVGQLRDQTRLFGLGRMAESGRLVSSAREHRDILDAIRARDADRAEALMRAHLEHTRGVWAGLAERDDPA